MGTYLASVWLNTQSVFDVTSAIDALPLRPLGIVPNSNQLATMEAGLQNFAAGANILVSYTDFSVKAAETAHALAEGTLQAVGTATAVGDIFTAAELASEGGCAAVIKAVMTKAAATAGAVVVSAAVATEAANMAREFGVSEDTLKIGADLLQVVLLAQAARAEAQAAQGGCFAGNTLVQVSDGPEPIDQIQIGQRVLTQVAEGPADGGLVAATDPNSTTVDPATWRELTLTMPDPADAADSYHIQLLEPTSWIANENAVVGGQIYLDLPEMTVAGEATVDSIGACPSIESGPGRVVLGTFEHISNDVVDITLKGEANPLQVTATHQVWSLDQDGWVEAGQLKPGEQLAGENGPVTVESVTPDSESMPVYNLDVDEDHQYLVTDFGALAHNTCPESFDLLGAIDKSIVDPSWARSTLRANMESAFGSAAMAGNEAHHGIPLELLKDPKYRGVIDLAAEAGFNFNGAENGVIVPTQHGPHEGYTDFVRRMITKNLSLAKTPAGAKAVLDDAVLDCRLNVNFWFGD